MKILKFLKDETPEGVCRKRFYLPVDINLDTRITECWIFPLAIFVLIYKIVKNILWSFWKDLFIFSENLKKELPHDFYQCPDCKTIRKFKK